VVIEDTVIDATLQQFEYQDAAIIAPFSTWLPYLPAVLGPGVYVKYVRGEWTTCRDFCNPELNKEAYFWDKDGTPLGKYDDAAVQEAKELCRRRAKPRAHPERQARIDRPPRKMNFRSDAPLPGRPRTAPKASADSEAGVETTMKTDASPGEPPDDD
jgi:hypothetical protein